jgi:hypothetical protein
MDKVTVTELENDGRRWVELNGVDWGTGHEFDREVVGVTPDGTLLDCDGMPSLTEGDLKTVAVRKALGL